MRKAIFAVTYEMLHDVLQLPDDIEVTETSQRFRGDFLHGAFYVRVRGDGLPGGGVYEVPEGGLIPLTEPTVTEPQYKDGHTLWEFPE